MLPERFNQGTPFIPFDLIFGQQREGSGWGNNFEGMASFLGNRVIAQYNDTIGLSFFGGFVIIQKPAPQDKPALLSLYVYLFGKREERREERREKREERREKREERREKREERREKREEERNITREAM